MGSENDVVVDFGLEGVCFSSASEFHNITVGRNHHKVPRDGTATRCQHLRYAISSATILGGLSSQRNSCGKRVRI